MWCLTNPEAPSLVTGRQFEPDASGRPVLRGRRFRVTASFTNLNWSQFLWPSEFLASSVVPFQDCLFWVTLFGVWSSSENWHLFYRLRESYGQRRQLADAPAHLFLRQEQSDLATFIELALLFGWDFYLLPYPGYADVFVSHDEFLEFHADDPVAAQRVKEAIEGATIEERGNNAVAE